MSMKFKHLSAFLLVGTVLVSGVGQAQTVTVPQQLSYSGKVSWLEVWTTGNISFRLEGVSNTCAPANAHTFVINRSAVGAKNVYAAILAAKLAGVPITAWSSGCGPAETYGGSTLYVQVDYTYVLD
jgi:hypothetical protein